MSSTKKSKSTPKPPKSRPKSTSAISQPALAGTTADTSSIRSSFSNDGKHFALVTQAVDKHRLRVFNAITGKNVAEYTVTDGKVSSIIWTTVPISVEEEEQTGKKRKKRKVDDTPKMQEEKEEEVILLGLSNGLIQILSPTYAKIITTLSHPTSSSPVLALAAADTFRLCSSSADGATRVWDTKTGSIIQSWQNDRRISYTSLFACPSVSDSSSRSSPSSESDHQGEDITLLAGHHEIHLLSVPSNESEKAARLASFTGHASSITHLKSTPSHSANTQFFVSAAENDRFISLWDRSVQSKPIASVPLDAGVLALDIHTTSSTDETSKTTLVAISTSGHVVFVPIPDEFPSSSELSGSASKTTNAAGVHTLLPRSTLSASTTAKDGTTARIIDVHVSSGDPRGEARIARLVNGVKPVFDVVTFLDDSSSYIPNLSLPAPTALTGDAEGTSSAPTKRYTENPTLGVSSGIAPDEFDGERDEEAQKEVDGVLAVDLAEISLGERLRAVEGMDVDASEESDSDPKKPASKASNSKKKEVASSQAIPATSLTRTLIQALHSSDTRLLESCLAHTDGVLIRNTVKKLPPQLAIPLIQACVERLGRGARGGGGGGGKGGGVASSAQRGMGLVVWVNAVLGVHMGHLMTIPDLVARLSGLHATLSSRLSLYESLLGLSGRLDTVLSQVEFRAATKPSVSVSTTKGKGKETVVKRYVEGEDDESSSEEDNPGMDVQVEVGGGSENEGSIEDVELGGSDSDEDSGFGSEKSGEDDEEEEGDSEDNEFIDDEAEEEDEYSEESDESE